VLFVVLAALAGAHTLIAQGQIHLDDVDRQVAQEQARYQQLRKDVAEAESPERIVAAAEAQGMVMPDDLQYLQPPIDDGIRVTGEGSASDAATARPNGDWSNVKPLLEVPTP
jgi:cell division protein FtsL